jgi:acetylornithine/succinyldiaminopimelate/putrescine aminotransferase/predicted amino acid dehydrogenase/acyl carrier protein
LTARITATMPKTRQEINAWLKARVLEQHTTVWSGKCTAIADLGIDSLSAIDLVGAIEQWLGVAVPSAFLSELTDTDELIQAIEALQTDRSPDTAGQSAYGNYVNPYLAAKLAQLKIDRTFVKAQGAYLFDREGRRYIDFMAQYGALPFGHHPPEIWAAIEALREDSEPIFAQPSLSLSTGELARRLISLAPRGLRYVTFSNSGAEAVEAALKMARQVTGRQGILSTRHGFHGKTFGALSATGNPQYQKHFGLPLPHFDAIAHGDLAALEATLVSQPGEYAAFIVETIQGEGGVRVSPPGYLRQAKVLCQRYGVLLIVDEVQTGLGRTGALFSCEAEDVCPDILTLAKALGGGVVPIGATLCTEAAYGEMFALKHSSTFAGNALAARAGLATLDLLTREDGALLRNVVREGQYLRERLDSIRARHPWLVEDVRGRGFMLGLCFTSDRSSWPENFLGIVAEKEELAQFVASYLLNVEGVRLAPTLNGGNVLRIQPPLNATHEQCVAVADALERTVDKLALRQTGDFYRAILRCKASPQTPLAVPAQPPRAPAVLGVSAANRFAFLLHPLDERGYADYDLSLATLEPAELREFSDSMAGLLDPVVGTTIEIQSLTGATARGDFIMISYTAEQLKGMAQSDVLKVLNKGMSLARERGASIVGLGAYTSIVSAGGTQLANAHTTITSGNSYTAVSAIEALDDAVERSDGGWLDKTVGIVGAAGAIGSCMAMLLSERAPRVVLIGNPAHEASVGRQRLMRVALSLIDHVRAAKVQDWTPGSLADVIAKAAAGTDFSAEAIVAAMEDKGQLILTSSIRVAAITNVVVTATSFPHNLIDDDLLPYGAIVCDISRPRSVSESILSRRPDVLVIDGGLIALPYQTRVGPYGVEDGTSYACMAETMLLALEGDFRDTSLGGSLDVAEVKRQQALARKHGFSLAGLKSFGRPLPLAT